MGEWGDGWWDGAKGGGMCGSVGRKMLGWMGGSVGGCECGRTDGGVDGQAGGMVGREMVKWRYRVKSGWTKVQLDGQDGEKGAR